jgi:hypothetical protein
LKLIIMAKKDKKQEEASQNGPSVVSA